MGRRDQETGGGRGDARSEGERAKKNARDMMLVIDGSSYFLEIPRTCDPASVSI